MFAHPFNQLDFMFKQILIATDGSKHAERAAKYGIELAQLTKGKLLILYVADTNRYLPAGGFAPPLGDVNPYVGDEVFIELRDFVLSEGKKATQRIEDVARKSGVPSEMMVVEGHPPSEILRVAKEDNADIIVMGSVGKSGLEKILLGSVAEKVVRSSIIPVLLIPVD
jgi:nucleotide-binding universal stress UspA family protein